MFKWFWTIFSLGAPGMCPGINTPNSVFWLVRDKRFLLEDTSKMTKFFFIILSFFFTRNRHTVRRLFLLKKVKPFPIFQNLLQNLQNNLFFSTTFATRQPAKRGKSRTDDPRHKKMVSMTTNSKLNIYLREVCSRRQSSCRTNKNMKNNM